MTKKVFLHVGLPKSGTTYIQAVLSSNKARLARRSDLLFPGSSWRDQVLAVRDLRAAPTREEPRAAAVGAWDRLRDEIAAWNGDAVVSMEWLGGCTSDQVGRIVESFEPAQVEVIATVRDLTRTIPAAWQEFLQNRELWTWAEFVRAVSSENPRATPAGNAFWSQQDLGKILAIWRDSVPASRVHVVTLPQPGSPAGELWTRFSQVLGIDGDEFDASGHGSNESLGRESADLMLRLNELSRIRDLDWKTYDEMFKQALAKRGLAKRKHAENPQRSLPPELHEWVVERTAEQVRAIKASGATVVGDLADLDPTFGAADPLEVESDGQGVLEAALEGLVSLAKDRGAELERLRKRNAQLARTNRQLTEASSRGPEPRPLRRAYGASVSLVRRVVRR